MSKILSIKWTAAALLLAACAVASGPALADACSTVELQNYTFTLSGSDNSTESGTISFVITEYPGIHENVTVNLNGTTTLYDVQKYRCTDDDNGNAVIHLHALSGGAGQQCVVSVPDYEDWTFSNPVALPNGDISYTLTTPGWNGSATEPATAQIPACT